MAVVGKIFFDKQSPSEMAGLAALIAELNNKGASYGIENGDDRFVEVYIYNQ